MSKAETATAATPAPTATPDFTDVRPGMFVEFTEYDETRWPALVILAQVTDMPEDQRPGVLSLQVFTRFDQIPERHARFDQAGAKGTWRRYTT